MGCQRQLVTLHTHKNVKRLFIESKNKKIMSEFKMKMNLFLYERQYCTSFFVSLRMWLTGDKPIINFLNDKG